MLPIPGEWVHLALGLLLLLVALSAVWWALFDDPDGAKDERMVVTHDAVLLGRGSEPTGLAHCRACGTVYRPLLPGARSCSLYCARCSGRPLAVRTPEKVAKIEERLQNVVALRARRKA